MKQQNWARVEGALVVSTLDIDAEMDPVSVSGGIEGWVRAPAHVVPGWTAEGRDYRAPPAHPFEPAPLITYKVDLYDRSTDKEAEEIEMALAAAPVRLRRLFESASFLDHSRPEFAMMRESLEGMFGKDRAAELLAAS